MNKTTEKVKLIIIFIFILLSFNAFSDVRQERWYTTGNGEYTVMERNTGIFYASIFLAADGKPNVYIDSYAPELCKDYGDEIHNQDPVYINGRLVNMSVHCRDDWALLFARSTEGRQYVIDQFKRSRFVTLRTFDGKTELEFSAIGFTDLYNRFLKENTAL